MSEGTDPEAPRPGRNPVWDELLEQEERYRANRRQDLERVQRRESELKAQRAAQVVRLGEARLSGIEADVAMWQRRIDTTDSLLALNEPNIVMYDRFIDASWQRTNLYRGQVLPGLNTGIEPGSRQDGLPQSPETPRPGNLPPPPKGYIPPDQDPEAYRPRPDPDAEAKRRDNEAMAKDIEERMQGLKPYRGTVGEQIAEALGNALDWFLDLFRRR